MTIGFLNISILVTFCLIYLCMGISVSMINTFQSNRYFRIGSYIIGNFILTAIIVLITSVIFHDDLPSPELGSKIIQIGLISFYIGTTISQNNKTEKSKGFRRVVAVFSIIGIFYQILFLFTQMEDREVSNIYFVLGSIRVLVLLIFSIVLLFPNFTKNLLPKTYGVYSTLGLGLLILFGFLLQQGVNHQVSIISLEPDSKNNEPENVTPTSETYEENIDNTSLDDSNGKKSLIVDNNLIGLSYFTYIYNNLDFSNSKYSHITDLNIFIMTITVNMELQEEIFNMNLNQITYNDFVNKIYSNYSIYVKENESNTKNKVILGKSVGSNIVLREYPTTKSAQIGSIKILGSLVRIIEEKYQENSNEAILKSSISFENLNDIFELPRGKAVNIISQNGNSAVVQINVKNRNYTVTINTQDLEFLSSQSWFQIENIADGQIGWVLSRFIAKN